MEYLLIRLRDFRRCEPLIHCVGRLASDSAGPAPSPAEPLTAHGRPTNTANYKFLSGVDGATAGDQLFGPFDDRLFEPALRKKPNEIRFF
jgi:hypothetical protein